MKTISTIFGVISLLFCFNNPTFSQNTFEFTIKDPLTDEIVNDAIELADGSYILACNQLNPLPSWKVHLVRLTPSGKQSGAVDFNLLDQSSGFMKILQINPDLFVLAGYTLSDWKYKIWMYEMDSLFDQINSKVFSLDTCNLFSLNELLDEFGNILCYGINEDPGQIPYSFIYRISPALDSLQYKMFTDHSVFGQPALLRKTDQSGYYFFLTGYSPSPDYGMAIVSLDDSLSILGIHGVPHFLTEFPNSRWTSQKDFIVTGRKDFIPNPNDRCIGVLGMDTNFSLNHELYIGDHDTVEWPGIRKNLDFTYTNSIFVGGTHNFCQWEICAINCWYSLTNMDSLLNVKWQKFYGGTANYTLWGLTATHDGGCMLYGTVYDSATQNNERDVYVIKVNSDGLVGGIDNKTNPLVHDAIVYPNPGKDYLTIESGPQISGAEFNLTSIDGKKILSNTLNERRKTLVTGFLPAGIYVWQILFHNKVVETGKWIRE